MKNIKLVIFDMGNTVLNFHSGCHTDDEKDLMGLEHMKNYIFEKTGKIIDITRIKMDFLDKWYSDFYKRKELIELDVREYLNSFLKKNEIELEFEQHFELMREFYKEYSNEVVMAPKLMDILKKLENEKIKVVIASNCILFDEIYIEIFRNLDIEKYIDKFVFSYSRKIRKPDSRIFIEIMGNYDFEPNEIIMVGDSFNADIEPAIKLGMKTIWFNRKNEINDYKVDFEIFNFEEVEKIIENYSAFKTLDKK